MDSAPQDLRELFERSGYVRVKNEERHGRLGSSYHKGWEVRLVVGSRKELATVRRWLLEAGFAPGRPYVKGRRIVQPLYGRDAFEWFAPGGAGRGGSARSGARGQRRPLRVRPVIDERQVSADVGVAKRAREPEVRAAAIVRLKRGGLSYAEIARRLGTSRQRVHQLAMRGSRKGP